MNIEQKLNVIQSIQIQYPLLQNLTSPISTQQYQSDNLLKAKQEYILSISSQNVEIEKNPLIATSYSNGSIQIIDLKNKQIVKNCKHFDIYIPHLQFIDQNSLLLCQGMDVNILDVEKNAVLRTFEGHQKTVLKADINKFRNLIVTGGYDKTILFWDQRAQKPVNSILAHSHEITSLSFSNDSHHLLSSAADGFTRVWSVHNGLCRKTLCVDNSSIPTYAKFNKNNKFVLLSTLNNMMTLWDWEKSLIGKQYKAHCNKDKYSEAYFIEQDGIEEQILTYSDDGQICLYDIMNEELIFKQEIEQLEENEIANKFIYSNKNIEGQSHFYLYTQDSLNIELYDVKQYQKPSLPSEQIFEQEK